MLPLSRYYLAAGVLVGLIFHTGVPEGIHIKDIEVSHKFKETLTVQAMIYPSDNIKYVTVHIKSEDNIIDNTYPMILNPSGKIFSSINLEKFPIIPFSTLDIWFDVEKNDGTKFNNEPINYIYEDNRFDWKTIIIDEFVISWYQDNPDLGEKILRSAHEGLTRIQNLFEIPSPKGIHIYAYSDAAEMQEALSLSGSWVAGHSKPELNIVMVSLPPGSEQKLEIERQIPHELTHVLLFEKIGESYDNLPRWLNEGLATAAEINPNPNHQVILEKAYDHDALIPIEDLCTRFPSNSTNIQLSYAEANSFVSYLQTEYGKKVIEELILSYSNGKSCELGIYNVFDRTLSELEVEWHRAVFDKTSQHSRIEESIPLIIVVAILFIVPIGLGAIRLFKIKEHETNL